MVFHHYDGFDHRCILVLHHPSPAEKDKETAKMRSELQVGDEIVTIGGIIGIIVSMKEDSLVIETGSDRSKVRLARWAISGKNTTAEPK